MKTSSGLPSVVNERLEMSLSEAVSLLTFDQSCLYLSFFSLLSSLVTLNRRSTTSRLTNSSSLLRTHIISYSINHQTTMTTSSSTAARAGTNTPSRSATTAASASASITSDVRMDQILDDEDHKHSVTSSQRTLTTLTIASLSGLQKEIQADNWKYEGQNNINSSSSNSRGSHGHAIVTTTTTSVSEHLL
jgi:hypothetical protein